jgi:hypothetical protein
MLSRGIADMQTPPGRPAGKTLGIRSCHPALGEYLFGDADAFHPGGHPGIDGDDMDDGAQLLPADAVGNGAVEM